MKNQRKFTVVIEHDEDGYYVGTVPTLRGASRLPQPGKDS
ncbi:MAG TPA: type II toxin-antitoxin system HicB family antitoxin [Candidatus Sulfotelmatobacter sp.]